MDNELRPTVWRTARALANENRLRFLRAVFKAHGAKSVSELAEEIGVAVSTASIYLRTLNARGLVDVKRQFSLVFYGDGSNRSLPEAMGLQSAFTRLFARRNLPDDWPQSILPTINAYAHPRRIELIRTISIEGPLTFYSLSKLAGVPETSLLRHLAHFLAAGILALDSQHRYVIVPQRNVISKALLSIATS